MKKRFHHNGRYICDIESTGDETKDIAIINQVAEAHGLNVPRVSPAEAIFRQAHKFATTAEMLFAKIDARPPDGMAVAPFVVNMAFSLELYLKALALQHGKKLHGHELKKLFKKLPASAQYEIERQIAAFSSASGWAGNVKTVSDLVNIIANLNSAFVDWRYSYEMPHRPLKIDFQPTIFLAQVLHSACAAGKPD